MSKMGEKDNVVQGNFWKHREGRPIDGSGGPPHFTGMEQRVSKLEDKMDKVQDTLSDIRVLLARMESRFDCIDERMSHLPTYKGIGVLVSSIVGAAAALTAVLHYFHIL